jgi:hypothetical protein
MPDLSPASALRKLQQAQAGLKKARQAIRAARESEAEGEAVQRVIRVGWSSLTLCFRLLAEIPIEAASEPVMTKQLAVQRYATALLVRLRRLARNEPIDASGDDDDLGDDDADY